jgi:hypothetical protein
MDTKFHLIIGLWCLNALSTIFLKVISGGQVYWWRKQEYPEKTWRMFGWIVNKINQLLAPQDYSIQGDRREIGYVLFLMYCILGFIWYFGAVVVVIVW